MHHLFFATLVGAALCVFLLAVPGHADTPAFPGTVSDYHGYVCHDFTVDGCAAKLVEPKTPAPGKPWIWRAMFWDAFPGVDLALLAKGYYVAYIEVGDTWGAPDAIRHWDPFYALLTGTYSLSKYPALEGLSRGGLYIYRWAAQHPNQVGCIYGDAPLCDILLLERGAAKNPDFVADWANLKTDYHFTSDAEAEAYRGNPFDEAILAPIAKAHVPIIHVVGDADTTVPPVDNTDILRTRYLALGGPFFEVVKHGCDHHPHGLSDPTVVVNFILSHSGKPRTKKTAADRSGEVITLTKAEWQ
jgi:pimeloyl-ACP methyl ester carboxylesterase